MNRKFFKIIAFVGIAAAFLLMSWGTRTGKMDPRPYRERGSLVPVASDARWPEKAIPVTLGTYVENIYDFAVLTQTFSAEGWVWLTWSQEFQDLLTSKQLTIDKCIFVANSVQASDFVLRSDSETPVRLPDGRYHQIFRFSGKFYANKLNFRRFPFEKLRFPLVFSINPENSFMDADHVHLVADTAQSALGEYIDIPGYITTGKQIGEFIYQFNGNLGLSTDHASRNIRFSRVQMEVIFDKSVIATGLQLILPLVIVMSVVLLAPNLAGSLWDVRVAIPSTALLTLVFLQQTYRTQLPTLPYVTFLDQVYSLCYAASLALFCLFVWSSNRLDEAGENEKATVVEQINRTDLRFQIGLSLGLVFLISMSWLFPVR